MGKPVSKPALDRRRTGILLHITSLPGRAATGDLGAEAYRFVDFLNEAGITVWQTLPIGPTQADGSPYQSSSVYAGNPRLIALHPLVEKGWLASSVLEREQHSDEEKHQALLAAWTGFHLHASEEDKDQFARFAIEHKGWLGDYALFRALNEEEQHCGWWQWPESLRNRKPQAQAQARARLHESVDYIYFEQFIFFQQWMALKRYANERGVLLFGDMPIFVAHDSAEVWACQELFLLDEEGHPTVVAGVPPDYFSETGQRWGNPIYRWDQMQENGFLFWIKRIQNQLLQFDLIRIDHFRAFEAYWEIPAQDETAIHGRWIPAPGNALLDRLHQTCDPLPLVAEDLGIITPEVATLRDQYGLPGMKVLQFAFSKDTDNPYLPFHHHANSVVYTGTHDNDTTLGWYCGLDDKTRHYVDDYLGHSREPMPWPMIRAALASRARLAILPMQDILALDGRHRMNHPGTTKGNWEWRFRWEQMDEDLSTRLRRLIGIYGRLGL